MSKTPIFLATVLLISAVSVAFIAPAVSANAPTQRLGFWLQESNPFPPPQTFFNAMFLAPPYPSSLQVMIFGILQDELSQNGCSASTHYVSQSISYWGQVAKFANSYPNIRLVFDIAFDSSSSTYGLSCFKVVVNALGQYSSVYGLGVEGEYTKETLSVMTTAMSYVTAVGKQFINYYPANGVIPSGGYYIVHTNFPGGDSGGYDQVGSLTIADSQTIGIDSGYYSNFRFPSTVSCPIGTSAITSSTAGWNQCVVKTELSTAVSLPHSQRQFVTLDVGFSSSGYFTGVSGQWTNQLWDNPTLRNWIWTDSNYQGNFILSTASVATSGTTTTTTSHSTTTTTITTSSATTTTTTTVSVGFDPSMSTYVKCPTGISSCGSASPIGTGSYASGTTVKLTANPYGGYVFSSWSICTSTCQSYSSNPLYLTLLADTKATAIFKVQG